MTNQLSVVVGVVTGVVVGVVAGVVVGVGVELRLRLWKFDAVDDCRCQNWRVSGRVSRTVRLRPMVTGGGGHNVYPGSGPLDGGNTLLPA